jgi:hypothetical protein
MRKRSLVISAILISALVLALAVIALAADPFVGTWKMNPAKSMFDGSISLKSFVSTIEAQKNGVKIVQKLVSADGKTTQRSWTAEYDGKDHPIIGDPDADTYSCTRPNSNTTKYIFKKSGKEMHGGQTVVSKDGKTSTIAGGGKDADGKAFTYTILMEKQ